MQQEEQIHVVAEDGLRGIVLQREEQPNDSGALRVRFEEGTEVLIAPSALQARDDGSYYLPISLADLGLQEREVGAIATASNIAVVIPVIAEELAIEKQRITTGVVRVRKLVREHTEVIDEPLLREEVEIERVPIGVVIEGPLEVRTEGDTTIIPILEEVIFVEKRLVLKEELHVRRRQTTEHRLQQVMLRQEDVTIERAEPTERGPDPAL